MTLHTGVVFLGLVNAPRIFSCLLFVTVTAIHRLGDVYTLSMFLQVYDVHMTTGTGIGSMYRIGIFLDLYGAAVALHTLLRQQISLHLDI
jgi:hypothetical protein